MIVAASANDVIGINNKIPWYIPEDMNHFKELTIGNPVIMGRKTYESIPEKFRPLPKRKNIILSSTLESQDGIYIARDIPQAIDFTEEKLSYITGGEGVYREFLPLIKRIELTRVHQNFDGDTFLPKINWNDWKIIKQEDKVSEKGNIPFSFLTYIRK